MSYSAVSKSGLRLRQMHDAENCSGPESAKVVATIAISVSRIEVGEFFRHLAGEIVRGPEQTEMNVLRRGVRKHLGETRAVTYQGRT